ncbi:DinB family protein [Paenibacillus sp. YYML68]|uniref:DinB family protein n=1 Tax=Paenibacillus sp. YYML68 TaxID=2909250 RepID=UPI002490B2BE|nr:DinB family protein [Paenibacillus sp. YYML68]
MKAALTRMLEHLRWANDQCLEALQAAQGDIEQPLKLLAHVLQAERIWLCRLNGEPAGELAIWPELSVSQCRELSEQNWVRFVEHITRMTDEDLTQLVTYTNSKGAVFHTAVLDILTHVTMHGCYHRGQLNMALRQSGQEPVPVDYITFARLDRI